MSILAKLNNKSALPNHSSPLVPKSAPSKRHKINEYLPNLYDLTPQESSLEEMHPLNLAEKSGVGDEKISSPNSTYPVFLSDLFYLLQTAKDDTGASLQKVPSALTPILKTICDLKIKLPDAASTKEVLKTAPLESPCFTPLYPTAPWIPVQQVQNQHVHNAIQQQELIKNLNEIKLHIFNLNPDLEYDQYTDSLNKIITNLKKINELDTDGIKQVFPFIIKELSSTDIQKFFNCFFKSESKPPVIIKFLLDNLYQEEEVNAVSQLFRSIEINAEKELGIIYKDSYVAYLIKNINENIISKFYNNDGTTLLKLKNHSLTDLKKLIHLSVENLKITHNLKKTAPINGQKLTAGLTGWGANLGYNAWTNTANGWTAFVESLSFINKGSAADNILQDTLLTGSFAVAAYCWAEWRGRKGRAPSYELALFEYIENSLLNKLLLEMQNHVKIKNKKNIFGTAVSNKLRKILNRSGGIIKELKDGNLLKEDGLNFNLVENKNNKQFIPYETSIAIFKQFIAEKGEQEYSLEKYINLFETLKGAFINFHINTLGNSHAKNLEGIKHFKIALNTMVFKDKKSGFRGTLYSHLLAKAKTNIERGYINDLWPVLTEDCASERMEENSSKSEQHIKDYLTYSQANYDGIDGVENYFTRLIKVDSKNWFNRIDAELSMHNFRLILEKNTKLGRAEKTYFITRLNHFLSMDADGPLHLLFTKRKRFGMEAGASFTFSQGYEMKRHAQTIMSIVTGAALDLGSVLNQVAVGTAGWVWASWLNPVVDWWSNGSTSTSLNLKNSLAMDLSYIHQGTNNNVQTSSLTNVHDFVNLIKSNTILTLDSADSNGKTLRHFLCCLKNNGILTSTLEDYHCESQPLIFTLLQKLDKIHGDEFLKEFYHDDKVVQEKIKKSLKNIKPELSDKEFENYWIKNVSILDKYSTFLSLQLKEINNIADNALFACLKAKAYLLSLNNDKLDYKYSLCKKEFQKFINSNKNISSPMRVIGKRSHWAAFWRKLLYRGTGAAAWGMVSNFLMASVSSLGNKTLLGYALAGLAGTPLGCGILAASVSILLVTCGLRLFTYSSSDYLNFTERSDYNKFIMKNCQDFLEENLGLDEEEIKKKVLRFSLQFINRGETKKEQNNRLYFRLRLIENSIWDKNSCQDRLSQMVNIINDESLNCISEEEKILILIQLLKRVEEGDANFKYLKQAETYLESKALATSGAGGAAAGLGAISTVALAFLGVNVPLISALVGITSATVGDAISTRCNTNYYENSQIETQAYIESVDLLKKSLTTYLDDNELNVLQAIKILTNKNDSKILENQFTFDEANKNLLKIVKFCLENNSAKETIQTILNKKDELAKCAAYFNNKMNSKKIANDKSTASDSDSDSDSNSNSERRPLLSLSRRYTFNFA